MKLAKRPLSNSHLHQKLPKNATRQQKLKEPMKLKQCQEHSNENSKLNRLGKKGFKSLTRAYKIKLMKQLLNGT